VAEGTATELARLANSATGRSLATPYRHSRSRRRPVGRDTPSIRIEGATLHNLRDVDARVPLSRLTVITGVSGSGKSSLARDVLQANLRQLLARPSRAARGERTTKPAPASAAAKPSRGGSHQSGAGSGPNSHRQDAALLSCDLHRLLGRHSPHYAATTDARIRGFTASRFSFNTAGGRCEACEGQGCSASK